MSPTVWLLAFSLFQLASPDELAPPRHGPDMDGVIEERVARAGSSGQTIYLRVEPMRREDRLAAGGPVWIRIDRETRLIPAGDEPDRFEYLVPGQLIETWFSASASRDGSDPIPAETVALEQIRVGARAQEARLLEHVQPDYPPEAIEAGIEGKVLLQVEADPKGRPYRIRKIRGHPLLAKAAESAVFQWLWLPTQLKGVPVAVEFAVELEFKPDEPATVPIL